MKTGLTVIIFLSLFWLSLTAGAIKFENKSNEDIQFFLVAKRNDGERIIPLLAHQSVTELVAKSFERASPTNTLWIFARWGTKLPVNDMFCHPTLNIKELRESDNKYKIIFDGNNCNIIK